MVALEKYFNAIAILFSHECVIEKIYNQSGVK